MNTAAKGRRNEHKSIRLLESLGYDCTRAAASKGVWDVIGIGPTDFVLCQVKSNGWPSSVEMEQMERFKSPLNAKKIVHRWRDNQRHPDVRTIGG